MLTTPRLARTCAAIVAAVLAAVGLVAVPAQAVTTTSITVHVDLGTAGVSAPAGAVTMRQPSPNTPFVTDANGDAVLTGVLGTGAHYLIVTYVGTGSYVAHSYWTVPAGATNLSIVLGPAVTISGHVDVVGDTVGAGDVHVFTSVAANSTTWDASTDIDANGDYVLTGIPVDAAPGFRISFSHKVGREYGAWYYRQGTGGTSYGAAQGTVLSPSTSLTGVDVSIGSAGARVLGQVTDASGAPVFDASIILSYIAGGYSYVDRRVRTDATGHYAMYGLGNSFPHSIRIEANPGHWLGYQGPATLDVSGELVHTVDVVLEPANRIEGDVSAAWSAGVPAHGAPPATNIAWYLERKTGSAWTPAGSGAAGVAAYATDDLVDGTYRVHLQYNGRLGSSSSTVSPEFDLSGGGVGHFDAHIPAPLSRRFQHDTSSGADLWWPTVLVKSTNGKVYGFFDDQSVAGVKLHQGSEVYNNFSAYSALTQPGDFTGDGLADILGRRSDGTLWVFPGNDMGWTEKPVKVGSGWSSFTAILSVGDVSGDGFPDLMARDSAGNLYIYPTNGHGGWGARIGVGTGWKSYTAIIGTGDLDGDTFNDFVARDSTGRLWLYPGLGAGTFGPRRLIGTGWSAYTIIGVGDLDGDGHADLGARDSAGRLWFYGIDGAAHFRARTQMGSGWSSLAFVG